MNQEANIRLQEIARETGVSSDKVKYWVKLLRLRLVVRGRIGFLEDADAKVLRDMIRLIGEGGSPKEIAEQLTGTLQPIPATPPSIIPPENTSRLDALEKSVMLLVDKIACQEKELIDQRKEIASLRSHTELPVLLLNTPPKPVKPWKPIRIQPPAMPWYERFLLQMFEPEALRVTTE